MQQASERELRADLLRSDIGVCNPPTLGLERLRQSGRRRGYLSCADGMSFTWTLEDLTASTTLSVWTSMIHHGSETLSAQDEAK